MQSCRRLSLTLLLVTALLGWGAAPRAQEPTLGRDFTLAPGRGVRVAGTSLSVAFVKVSGDSRCPKEARCIAAGDAIVHLTLTSGRAKPVAVTLHTERPRPVTHGEWQITLTDLQPEMSIEKPPAQKDYVVTLRVTR